MIVLLVKLPSAVVARFEQNSTAASGAFGNGFVQELTFSAFVVYMKMSGLIVVSG